MTIYNQSLVLRLIAFAPSLHNSSTAGIDSTAISPSLLVSHNFCFVGCPLVRIFPAGCNIQIWLISVAMTTANTITKARSWHGLVTILEILPIGFNGIDRYELRREL